MLLMFSKVENTLEFSVNHNKSQKLYFEPQLFTQQKNISYKETFYKEVLASKQGFTPNHCRNKVGIVMLATEKVNCILSHSLKSHRESPDQQKQFILF